MADAMLALWHMPRDPALVTQGATMPSIWVHNGHGRSQCSTILSVSISKLPPGYRSRLSTPATWYAVVGARSAMYQAFAHPIPYSCATHGVTRRPEFPGARGYFETKTCVSYAAAMEHLTMRLRQRALGDGGGPNPTPHSPTPGGAPGAVAYASAACSVSLRGAAAVSTAGAPGAFSAHTTRASAERFPKGSGFDDGAEYLYFYSHHGQHGYLSQVLRSPIRA